jgi:hypothetical protein
MPQLHYKSTDNSYYFPLPKNLILAIGWQVGQKIRFIQECKDTFGMKPDYTVSTSSVLQYRSNAGSFFITIPLTLAHYLCIEADMWLKPLNYSPEKGLLIKIMRDIPYKRAWDKVYTYDALHKWKTREQRKLAEDMRDQKAIRWLEVYKKHHP